MATKKVIYESGQFKDIEKKVKRTNLSKKGWIIFGSILLFFIVIITPTSPFIYQVILIAMLLLFVLSSYFSYSFSYVPNTPEMIFYYLSEIQKNNDKLEGEDLDYLLQSKDYRQIKNYSKKIYQNLRKNLDLAYPIWQMTEYNEGVINEFITLFAHRLYPQLSDFSKERGRRMQAKRYLDWYALAFLNRDIKEIDNKNSGLKNEEILPSLSFPEELSLSLWSLYWNKLYNFLEKVKLIIPRHRIINLSITLIISASIVIFIAPYIYPNISNDTKVFATLGLFWILHKGSKEG